MNASTMIMKLMLSDRAEWNGMEWNRIEISFRLKFIFFFFFFFFFFFLSSEDLHQPAHAQADMGLYCLNNGPHCALMYSTVFLNSVSGQR